MVNLFAPFGPPTRPEQFFREKAEAKIEETIEAKIKKAFEDHRVSKRFQNIHKQKFSLKELAAGEWVFRELDPKEKNNMLTVIETAEKIRALMQKNGLDNYITPPQKRLYHEKADKAYAAFPNRRDLVNKVATPADEHAKQQLARLGQDLEIDLELGEQDKLPLSVKERSPLRALANCVFKGRAEPAGMHKLKDSQAKLLAKLALEFPDLTYDNLFFDAFGEITIENLSPSQKVSVFSLLLGGERAFRPIRAFAWLKLCTEGDALEEVKKVEKEYVLRKTAQLAIAVLILSYGADCCVKVMLRMPIHERVRILGIEFIVGSAFLQNTFLVWSAHKLNKLSARSSVNTEGAMQVIREGMNRFVI